MTISARLSRPERRLLPDGRAAGPMLWVIAIMVFLTVLAAAAGLALGGAGRALTRSMAGQVTIQIVEADPRALAAQAEAAERAARALPGIGRVARLSQAQMAQLLAPWVGQAGADLPLPVMIDVDLGSADAEGLQAAVVRAAPSARVDAHAAWLGPVADLVRGLGALALLLILLTAAATAAAVALAARAALDTHRATIDVLHLLGATDTQIARLFERRIAVDALIGGAIGFLGGLGALWLVSGRVRAIGADLGGGLGPGGYVALLAVPLGGALLATVAARLTAERALRGIP